MIVLDWFALKSRGVIGGLGARRDSVVLVVMLQILSVLTRRVEELLVELYGGRTDQLCPAGY